MYRLLNRDRKNKVVLIEHPYRADWRLTEPSQPSERTRDVYRFAVPVEPGRVAELRVREEQHLLQTVHLMDSGTDVIAYYQQARHISPKVSEALQRVITLRDRLGQTAARRSGFEQRSREITQEQTRIRENMGKLAHQSELYSRYVKNLDQQETELDRLRTDIEKLRRSKKSRRGS